jgi:oligopeptidase B
MAETSLVEAPGPPPAVEQRLHPVPSPHGVRLDPYYWLRDDSRSDPDVLRVLQQEAAYTDAMLAGCKDSIATLYREIVGRIKQDDASVPVRYRGFWYFNRYQTGCEYPQILRRADQAEAPEELLLDCNALARDTPFFQLGSYEVSPDNRWLAYTIDTIGRRQFTVHIKNLLTGELLSDAIVNVEPGVAWADDNRSVLYVEKDPVTLLGRRVRLHVLGTEPARDPLLYEEADESFDLTVARTKSEKYLLIGAESTTASEWLYCDASNPLGGFKPVLARAQEHEYQVDHLNDRFVIRTNELAVNFRIIAVPVAHAENRAAWRDVVPHDADVFVHAFEIFREFLAVNERSGGLMKIRLQRWEGSTTHLMADDPAYTMRFGSNPELDSATLRYVYTSLTTPATTFDFDLRTGARTLLKREPVLGDFDPANYASEFVWVAARDGARIPVSIVYRKTTALDGTAPLYLYAYGSYGLSIDPAFSSSRLSLLDRGFVFAIAHVRGGQELGRRWYDAGRLMHKWNTFNDFIDVTDYVVAHKYAARNKVFAAGGSAGGLLMGVIANVAGEKFRALIAHVPFVDIVTTMLDESIPLTTLEYDEWGNPNERDAYEYMLSYSPYDNVKPQPYPALFVTTGLWDSQVQYFEPAKWVAKLRALRTNDEPLLFHVNLEAGHGGKSGRYQRLLEIAREYGFITGLLAGKLATLTHPQIAAGSLHSGAP